MIQAQKPWAKIEDQITLQLLIDNIHCLEYPLPNMGTQYIKLPYFDERFAPNQQAVQETKRRFCEALVLLLEDNDRLRKRTRRARKAS